MTNTNSLVWPELAMIRNSGGSLKDVGHFSSILDLSLCHHETNLTLLIDCA